MKATPACPDHATLVRLRNGDVPKAEKQELLHHVKECAQCRAVLRKLLEGKSGVRSGASGVRSSDSGSTHTLQHEGTPHHHVEATEASDEDWQAMLAPSKRAGSLGKLNHYEVLELIGRGGMGIVLRGFDQKLQRMVAIKLLAPGLAGSATARKRFVREARAAAAVRDNHVVNIYDVDENGPVPFLVMEFIAGVSLDKRLKRGGAMEARELVRIGIQIAEGLAAAHKEGLVHRDIKPANILLETGGQHVKITDFGLARAVDDAGLTQSGVVSGTPMYMAPEQAQGDAVDHRADLFSFGSVLYAMCTGHSPFRATGSVAVIRRVCDEPHKPLRQVRQDVPEWLSTIVDKLLAKDPTRRPTSAKVVADQLRRHLATLPDEAEEEAFEQRAETVLAPKAKRARSRKILYATLIAGACVMAGAILVPVFAWDWLFPSNKAGSNVNTIRIDIPSKLTQNEPPAFIYKPPSTTNFKRESYKRFLEIAGGGHAENAPAELAAVIGHDNWLLPYGATGSWIGHSHDGKQLAIATNDTIEVFNAESGKHQLTITEIGGRLATAAFHPKRNQIAVVSVGATDNAIRLLDVNDGRELTSYRGSKWPVSRIVFAPNGEQLVSVGGDSNKRGEAIIWDVATGKKLRELVGHAAHIRNVAFSPQGNRLATAADDQTVRTWDSRTGVLERTIPSVPIGPDYGLAFSHDGSLLAVGNFSQVKIWSTATWSPVGWHPWTRGGEWLAFRGPSKKLLAANQVRVSKIGAKVGFTFGAYDIDAWQATSHASGTPLVAKALYSFSPNLDQLVVLEADPLPTAFDVCRCFIDDELRIVTAAESKAPRAIQALNVSADGNLVAVIKSGEGYLWDLKAGKPTVRLADVSGLMNFVAFSPDGTLLATSSNTTTKTVNKKAKKVAGGLVLWNAQTGVVQHVLTGARLGTYVSFSPDSKFVYTAGVDGKPKRWRTADGEPMTEAWGVDTGAVTTMAASPDGRFVATGGTDKVIRLLDAETGSVVKRIDVPDAVNAVRFSNDGKTLGYTANAVVGRGESGERRLWDVPSFKELPQPSSYDATTTSFAIHPTRRLTATSLSDGTIHLSEHYQGKEQIHRFGPGLFGKEAKRVVFTPDGEYLAAGGENGTVSILRVPAPGALGASQPIVAKKKSAASAVLKGWGTSYDPDGDCFFVPSGSQLNIIVPPGAHGLFPGKSRINAPRILQDTQEDFSLQVRVSAFPNQAAAGSAGDVPYVAAGLLIWQDEQNFIRFERARRDDFKAPLVIGQAFLKGSLSTAFDKSWPIRDEDLYLKVTRKGDLMSFELKYAGEPVWKRLDTAYVNLPNSVKAGVHAVNLTTKVFSPQFQEFELGAVAKTPPPAAVLPGNLFYKDSFIPGWGQVIDPEGDCRFAVEFGTKTLTIGVPAVAHDLTIGSKQSKGLNAPRVLQDVQGDFDVQATLMPFTRPYSKGSSDGGATLMGAGLLIWQDAQNFVRWERVVSNGASSRILLEQYLIGNPPFSKGWDIPDEVTALRVERRDKDFTFSIRPPGEKAWKIMHTLAMPTSDKVKVGVHAINSSAAEFLPQFQALQLTKIAKKPAPVKVIQPQPGTFALQPVVSAIELANKPSLADKLKRADVPAEWLAKLGTGNNDAPPELVGVLGKPGDAQVVSLAISKDGSRLAAAGWRESKANLFDLASGKPLKTLQTPKTPVDLVAISPDGSIVAVAGSSAKTVQLFDAANGELRTSLASIGSLVLETVFSPDGALVAIGDNAGNIKFWEAVTGKEQVFKVGLSQVNRMSFSPDGKFLACSGHMGKDRPIIVMDVMTGKPYGPLLGHTDVVLGLAWHPGGQKLASADNKGSIRLWNLITMSDSQLPWESDGFKVHGLAWHPSGEFLASSNHTGGTITLWDMRGKTARRHRGFYLFPPDAESKSVSNANNDILFTPEGRHLIAGNSDGTISVLRLAELGKMPE